MQHITDRYAQHVELKIRKRINRSFKIGQMKGNGLQVRVAVDNISPRGG